MFEIDIWKADHTGGTKFYQVLTFKSPNGSFAISHYGGKGVFIGLGKASTGQTDFLGQSLGQEAGRSKRDQKSKDGYTRNVENKREKLSDLAALKKWAKDHLGDKALKHFNAGLTGAFTVVPDTATPEPKRDFGPKEADHIRHPDYGTW